MKSYGLVIDEALQPPRPHATLPNAPTRSDAFPAKPSPPNTTESYSIVVEQAIVTQDKPLLKEIIAECSPKLLRNTIAGLQMGRVSGLLSLLEEFLYEDSRNTEHYCGWLKELVCRHIGILLANADNKATVCRLRRFIQRKAEERHSLLQMQADIKLAPQKQATRQFVPKFSYVETQGETQPVPDPIDMEELDLGEEDFMMDEFDD